MKYTINNKEYTEFDINKRCAELCLGYYEEGFRFVNTGVDSSKHYSENFPYQKITGNKRHWKPFEPCTNWQSAGKVIEKCWDELNFKFITKITHVNSNTTVYEALNKELVISKWEVLVQKHNCTKLVAACICFIELKEQGE